MTQRDFRSADSAWWEAVRPFFENSREKRPKVAALATLLRSDEPLARGTREVLAELIDPRWNDSITCDWQLRPMFVDRKKKTGRRMNAAIALAKEVERLTEDGKSVSKIMADAAKEVGMSQSKAWPIWKKMRLLIKKTQGR